MFRRDDGRGSEVSLGDLRQDQLVQGQVRDRLTRPFIFFLKALEFFQLVGTHPTILLAPTVVDLLGNANLPDGIDPQHPLTDKDFNLPQLRDNFFWLVTFRSHFDPPFSETKRRITSKAEDQGQT